MSVRIVSRKFRILAAGMVIFTGLSAQFLSGEEHKAKVPSTGNVQPLNPFHIYSACPPAVCNAQWDGLSDPAVGFTDFTSAGIPMQFSFSTGNPTDWFCDYQTEHCHADYNSGTFTATGPAGTFNGVITSGFADQAPLSYEIAVSFSGQWSNGQHMTGSAIEKYVEEFQIPNATLILNPAH